MNKILLVARRELLTRIRKKTFLLSTILLPLLIFVFYGMIIYFSVDGDEGLTIAIADKANLFDQKLEGKGDLAFKFVNNASEAELKEDLKKEEIEAWQHESSLPIDFKVLSGGHFFIYQHVDRIIYIIAKTLSSVR